MKVKVHEDCFIGGSFRFAGSIVEYDGKLSKWMEPVDVQPVVEVEPRRPRKSKEDDVLI
jgi:hypothetical protein